MIKETGITKTLREWNESKLCLTPFLQIGDAVDEDIFDYFLGVLPPACISGRCLQIGEPSSYADGKPTFATLVKQGEKWIFAGEIATPKNERCLYVE